MAIEIEVVGAALDAWPPDGTLLAADVARPRDRSATVRCARSSTQCPQAVLPGRGRTLAADGPRSPEARGPDGRGGSLTASALYPKTSKSLSRPSSGKKKLPARPPGKFFLRSGIAPAPVMERIAVAAPGTGFGGSGIAPAPVWYRSGTGRRGSGIAPAPVVRFPDVPNSPIPWLGRVDHSVPS